MAEAGDILVGVASAPAVRLLAGSPIASIHGAGAPPGAAPVTRRPRGVVLLVAMALGLAAAACTRVQSHFALPELAATDAAFLPTVEAYTSATLAGNTATP